ncbi:hypothetical protein [Pontimicrobium aquaticum]|uniref:Uncharacterized protein n=1 Tax=Pontimicrobium aquaticum TaxID=2565367 RepID=A0A4U0EUB6_9FLAO|nr:hypothetical protein [Pontimicrobium aquaticum]TJY34824.1 hypothetical protein E5167_11005 [Pontimicrobium aquaticum]
MIPENNTLEILTLIFTIVTTICALYISYVALKHSARPKIVIDLLNDDNLICNQVTLLRFKVLNKGQWYSKPMAVGLNIYCNFDKYFELKKMYYGSVQQLKDKKAKKGVGNMSYFKAKGLKVGGGKEGEEFHVKIIAPKKPGTYQIRVEAYSDNGVSYRKDINIKAILNNI